MQKDSLEFNLTDLFFWIYKPGMKNYIHIIVLSLFLFLPGNLFSQVKPYPGKVDMVYETEQENLDVFQQWIMWNNPGSLLLNYLTDQAVDLYEKRDSEVAVLNTKSEWLKRQQTVKEKLMETMGPFPPKTPLNPKITGTIRKEGFRIEKLVYESMPGFYVTGCIYVPDKINGKAPAILNVIGHNQEAFRNELYQVLNLNFVKKGIIVLAIDPPGQGEHVQYFDPEINFSSVGYTVIEHCYFGNQCFLSGYSCAKYFIWDGIRGIDYLISRGDVDPDRIGVTGFSGGGTVTALISAFDERVKVSVPCSWSNAYRRLLETKGAPDAEAVLYHSLNKGITFEDLLEVRAPKPTLMTFVSRDQYLTLQGAREAFMETKKAYAAFGREDDLEMVEDDSKHWMTPRIRTRMYAFFMKHFNLSGDTSEHEVEVMQAEELQVTPAGQILTSFGGDMIFDVNKRITEKLVENLVLSRKNTDKHLAQVRIRARELSGYIDPGVPETGAMINGRYRRDGYSVGKYAIMGEGDYPVPFLLFVPDNRKKKHPAIIYVHPKGKITEAQPGGEIEKLVKRGYIVAAVDVSGIGETKNTAARGLTDGYTAVLVGRSVVGIQSADIVRVARYLVNLDEVDPLKIGAVGINEMCIPVLHACAFDKSLKNVVLIGSPVSYRDIVMNRFYKIGMVPTGNKGQGHPYELEFTWGVAGVLTAYDLPDLMGCMAPGKIVLSGLKDHALENASTALIGEEMEFPRRVYAGKGVSDNLKITTMEENTGDLVDWCFK